MKRELIQFINAVKYFFILNPNKEKANKLYKEGKISLFVYKEIMR